MNIIQYKGKERLEKVDALVTLLGLTNIFGAQQKAIDFSITYTLESLKGNQKVIPILENSDLDLLITSIKKQQEIAKKEKELIDLKEMPKK
jgi:hypothetical protein